MSHAAFGQSVPHGVTPVGSQAFADSFPVGGADAP